MMKTSTARYVRTEDHRHRRLTIHHVAQTQEARTIAQECGIVTVTGMITAWHVTGSFGGRPVGVGPRPCCLDARRRAEQRACWDAIFTAIDRS